MNEMNPNLPPSLDAALNQFYTEPQPEPAFAARLEAQLRQRQIQMVSVRPKSAFSFSNLRQSLMQTLRTRPILALLVALLALGALTGMVVALGRVTGFIPGFGFTSNAGLVYVLAEPVESTQGGVTLRLKNAVSDDARFWTDLTVQGATGQEFKAQAFQAFVLMPDGKMLQFKSGTKNSTQLSFSFPALSPGTQALSLYVVNLEGQNFNLALRLRPVKSGEIIPVQPTGAAPQQSENIKGLRLVVDPIAPASDKTVFQVSLAFDQPNMGAGGPWSIMLADEAGRVYPLKDITTMSNGNTKIYQTVPFRGDEQLTVSLVNFPGGDALPVIEDFPVDQPGFSFDPGPNPKIGQSWTLDETLNVGSYKLHAVRATLQEPMNLVFEFEPAGSVTGVMLYTADPLLRGSSGGVPSQGKNFTTGMRFDSLPAHAFEVHVRSVYSTLQGPGWVHRVSENNAVVRPGQNYPPPYLKKDEWYEIDADGYVTRSVNTDWSSTGQILQQAAAVGKYSMNFTYGESRVNDGQRYRVSFDLFGRRLNQAAQENTPILRESIPCENGSPCLLITSHSAFAAPIQNPGETQVYYGSGGRVWIDVQTGQQVKTETFWVLKDGKEIVTSTIRVLSVEKVAAPPQEILNMLAKVIVPKP